jgi:hypothetical protein
MTDVGELAESLPAEWRVVADITDLRAGLAELVDALGRLESAADVLSFQITAVLEKAAGLLARLECGDDEQLPGR